MEELIHLIQRRSKRIKDQTGNDVTVLKDRDAVEIAEDSGASVHDVHGVALKAGICPYRYIRNRETISLKDQEILFNSRVTVVGAGGLGGAVILLLARIGIGEIVVVDPDRFDETNLNRQALATMAALGRPKVEEAVRVVASVNPAVRIIPHETRLEAVNGASLIDGSAAVVDALDNVTDRLVLEQAARSLKIPLVHGALAGLEGQLMTVYPQDPGLSLLYGEGGTKRDRSQSPEAILGVPALMPAFLGALQVTEVVKILLKREGLFRHTMLHLDLEVGEIERFSFGDL
jgi:molybdopterin/thiamine biosynthesis adenylyltransferase